jgi:hypothetical protein
MDHPEADAIFNAERASDRVNDAAKHACAPEAARPEAGRKQR